MIMDLFAQRYCSVRSILARRYSISHLRIKEILPLSVPGQVSKAPCLYYRNLDIGADARHRRYSFSLCGKLLG